jgi:hypothetical protein
MYERVKAEKVHEEDEKSCGTIPRHGDLGALYALHGGVFLQNLGGGI